MGLGIGLESVNMPPYWSGVRRQYENNTDMLMDMLMFKIVDKMQGFVYDY